MSTPDMIDTLRDWAAVEGAGSLGHVLNEAAEMLEKYKEMVNIMMSMLKEC